MKDMHILSTFIRFVPGFIVLAPSMAHAATLQVGPGKTYAKPCAAIGAAAAGDVIEVDAAGNYDGDHCAWTTDNLTVRGVGGRAKIDAGKIAANSEGGKGIFVVGAPNATIESFELAGAVVASANGAGIRHEGTNLIVRNCYLHDNEDGILGSPSTVNTGELLIESSELADNGAGDGLSHNMYLGHYAKLTLRFSYSHGAKVGHLVKSRALENHIEYNRLTDEVGTTASYELSFPSAGTAYVIGNIIEQAAASQNPNIVDYASEPGTLNPDLHLFVINNTIVNDGTGGTFVVDPTATPAVLTNNIFVGPGTVCSQATANLTTNLTMSDPMLAAQATYDYQLLAGSPAVNAGTDPGMGAGQSLAPMNEYVHPRKGTPRSSLGKIDIGAYELGNPGAPADAGADGSMPQGDGGRGGESTDAGGGISDPTPATSDSSGCGCRVAHRSTGLAAPAGLVLLLLAARRRRRAGAHGAAAATSSAGAPLIPAAARSSTIAWRTLSSIPR